jgi:threonine/homoserine/homoserine lactone efflux protein
MITTELLIGLFFYTLVGSITPGPNNMMLMASGMNYGFTRTIPHLCGIMVGNALMLILAGAGLLTVLSYFPLLYDILHVVSIIYLLYLAWKIAHAAPLSSEGRSNKKPMYFWQALAFQWINPKALVIVMVIITTYVPDTPGITFVMNMGIVTLVDSLVLLPCILAWVLGGKMIRGFLRDPKHCKMFNYTMGLLLVASVLPALF